MEEAVMDRWELYSEAHRRETEEHNEYVAEQRADAQRRIGGARARRGK